MIRFLKFDRCRFIFRRRIKSKLRMSLPPNLHVIEVRVFEMCSKLFSEGVQNQSSQCPHHLHCSPHAICHKGHTFDIKHNNNTTVARHFYSHNYQTNPSMIIHILEYIRLPRDVPRSKSIRDNRELVWIHRLNTLVPSGLNILD